MGENKKSEGSLNDFRKSRQIFKSPAIRESSEDSFLGRDFHKLTSRVLVKLTHTLLKSFLSFRLLLLKKCNLLCLLSLKHHMLRIFFRIQAG